MLVRFFAAEGVLQGHKVFVALGGGGAGGVGAAGGGGERWGRDLPGLAAGAPRTQLGKQGDDDGGGEGVKKEQAGGEKKEKMKIAWRYERLGEFGGGGGGGGGGLAAGSRGTKDVSFPVLSSLVHSEKQKTKKKNKKIIPDSFATCFYVWKSANKAIEKPPQRQTELCQCPPLRVKLVHHLPRHQYSAILLTLQND